MRGHDIEAASDGADQRGIFVKERDDAGGVKSVGMALRTASVALFTMGHGQYIEAMLSHPDTAAYHRHSVMR